MKTKSIKYSLLIVMVLTAIHSHAQLNPEYKGVDLLKDTSRMNPDLDKENPLETAEKIFMNEMTWMEVRDAIKSGKTTAIVMTGGLEMNGPYLVTDKHNIACKVVGERLAKKLGNALIATVVPYVPQGNIDPPEGHIRYPGTISVRESTFEALLIDISNSLRIQGFKNVILLGDSGGNQPGLLAVQQQLSQKWKDARIFHIPEYYGYEKWIAWQEEKGIFETSEGIHDTFRDTVIMMLANPEYVRKSSRQTKGLFSVNGVDLDPIENTLQIANELVDYQAALTAQAILQLIEP